jgi:hypothetical protein
MRNEAIMSLSVREQINEREQYRFTTALNNLSKSERVHKSDLKIINKTLDKMDKIGNTKELLSTLKNRMQGNFNIDDSSNVKSFIDSVKGKLEQQNSKIHDKKLMQINNIGSRILQASQALEVESYSKEIKQQTSLGKDVLGSAKTDKSLVHKIIDQRNEFKKLVATSNDKLSRITPDEISKDQEKRIQNLTQEAKSDIDKLGTNIRRINNREPALIKFLTEHGKHNVINDLEKAKSNPYLKADMATSRYAENNFGTRTIKVEGRREWSTPIKKQVLSESGEIFLSRIAKYNNASKDLANVQKQIKQIEFSRDAKIESINSETRSPQQLKHDSKIAEYNHSYQQKGIIGKEALAKIGAKINFVDRTIEKTTTLQKAIQQKAKEMADPEVEKLATRHNESIEELAEKKEKLINSYSRLINAAETEVNYTSDVDTDSESDYESHA